jgi:hypothetical protein
MSRKNGKPEPKYFDKHGRPLLDATRKLTFTVTQEDIDNADPRKPQSCVVARGINRSIPVEVSIDVGTRIVHLTFPDRTLRYATPELLSHAVRNFDKNFKWDLPPGVYELNVLPPSLKLGYKKPVGLKRKAGGPSGPSGRRRYARKALPLRHIRPVRAV